MRMRSVLGLGLIVAATGLPVVAQTATKTEKPKAAADAKGVDKKERDELAAIRKASQEFINAFNRADAKAIAALWTKDGDYTTASGEVVSGREGIEKAYAEFFAANPDAKIQLVLDSLRLLSDTAAIEDGRVILETAVVASAGTTRYFVVHIKSNGQWLMSSVRDTQVDAAPAERDLDDLAWLIGTWSAEEYGSATESVCRWVADQKFLERTYTVKHPDGKTSSGIQLIGYNPQGGHLQSWNFSSDGGFATGIWMPQENGWSAEMVGTTGDGISTTAVNLIRRLDDNAYSWQSVSRTADGVPLPDTTEVVNKRSTPAR